LPHAWEEYLYWHGQDRKTLKRINALITEATRNPFSGTGKPEPLTGNLSGYWSRRIDETTALSIAQMTSNWRCSHAGTTTTLDKKTSA